MAVPLDDPEALIRAAMRAVRLRRAIAAAARPLPAAIINGSDRLITQVEGSETVSFNGTRPAKLKVKIEVYTVNRNLPMTTEVGYHAYISLQRPKRKRWDDLGHIRAWRIIKPSIGNPTASHQGWVTDWLTRPYRTGAYEGDQQSTAAVLNSIYGIDDNVSNDVGAEFRSQFKNDATGNDLMYIQQLFVRSVNSNNPNITYRGNNYARTALDVWYRLLTGTAMPAAHRFSGPTTVLLEPGLILDPVMGAPWQALRLPGESIDDLAAKVQPILEAFYRNRGFDTYVDLAEALYSLGIMGRVINPPLFPARAGDRRCAVRAPGGFRQSLSASPRRIGKSRDDMPVTPSRPRGKGPWKVPRKVGGPVRRLSFGL